MLKTYWHIAGPGFDVDEFLARHELQAVRVWYQGQKNEQGDEQTESGCTILISDSDDTEQHFDQVNEYLESRYHVIDELAERGIQSTVDTAFSVEQESQSKRSLKISPKVLSHLGKAGVELEISAHTGTNGHGKSDK